MLGGAGPRLSARRIGAVALLAVCCASAEPAAAPRSVLVAWPPEPEVRAALRYVMTELRRLSNRFRYASLTTCHRAEAAEVDGERSLFLDVEFDMLRGQPSRHNVILFKDGDGAECDQHGAGRASARGVAAGADRQPGEVGSRRSG